MFIYGLNRHAAKVTACSVALIVASTIASHATSVAELPRQETRTTSFVERFDVTEASTIPRLLASPTYRAPVFRQSIRYVPAGDSLDGAASMYDPTDATDRDSGDMNTSSGETYDPEAWTAAIRTDLRDQFGGVRYGKNYVRSFALVEGNGLRLIVRINDVGPLRPGRVIDLNRRAMRYLDPSLKLGVLEHIKVTPLAGSAIAAGPVEDAPTFASRFVAVWQ
jgi:rare lipoprotein A